MMGGLDFKCEGLPINDVQVKGHDFSDDLDLHLFRS